MRFQLSASLLCFALLGLLIFAVGCTKMPVTSIMKLARVDFETTDLAAVRAAVLLPAYLRPKPGSARLTVTVGQSGGSQISKNFKLRETDDPEAAMLNEENRDGKRVYAYMLPPEAAQSLEHLRHEAVAVRQDGKVKQTLTVSIAADACRVGRLPSGPLPMTTYLKTQETRSFVPLVRNVDIRSLEPDKPLKLARCAH